VMMNGTEADTMQVDGQTLSIRVEYPDTEYDTREKVGNILLTSASGSTAFLKDIADIAVEDSPTVIQRVDKQYRSQITASYTDIADRMTGADINRSIVQPNLTGGTAERVSSSNQMMNEEFGNLGRSILIAVFLVFVVMAAQFESVRFSVMVMTTIPFALAGSIVLLWLFDAPLSMPSIIGILMLVGMANIVDLHVVGTGSALRGAVICFYMSNEMLTQRKIETNIFLSCITTISNQLKFV